MTPAPTRRAFTDRHSFIGLIGELVTVFAAAGFVASIVINTVVFRHWRLNFMQIASSSDVLMSGFDAALRLGLVLMLWLGPMAAVIVLDPTLYIGAGYRRTLAILGSFGFLVIALAYIVSDKLWGPHLGMYQELAFTAFACGMASMSGLFAAILITFPHQSGHASTPLQLFFACYRRAPYLFIVLLCTAVLMTIVSASVIQRYMTSGYLGSAHYLSAPPPGCEGKVLWMGERNLIITCMTDTRQRYAIVNTLDAQSLLICDGLPATARNAGAAGPRPLSSTMIGCLPPPRIVSGQQSQTATSGRPRDRPGGGARQ